MADPRPLPNAARLSEDIDDVLSAIRRMIADDEGLSAARLRAVKQQPALVQDDPAEFLARRYGGNAALARQLVENGARPLPGAAPVQAVQSSAPVPLRLPIQQEDAKPEDPASPPAAVQATGWRGWLRPAARDAVAGPEPEVAARASLPEMGDDSDDFAEAFEWKARLRPAAAPVRVAEISRLAPAEVEAPRMTETPGEPRRSGWAMAQPEPPVAVATPAPAASGDEPPRPQALLQDADIRSLLRELVQNELNGELGVRFSANLRVVIRREVAAAIDAHLDRL